MYAFVILLGLGLGLGVVVQVLAEVLPFEAPKALTRTVTAALAIGLAWGLDYSVFDAFGQSLREQWMHPVATGIVLTAGEADRECRGDGSGNALGASKGSTSART